MLLYRMLSIRKSSLTIFTILMIIVIILSTQSTLFEEDRELKLKRIDDMIKNQASSSSCKQPNLSVYSPEIMKFVHTVPKIDCSEAGEDWVKCIGSRCAVQENIEIQYGPIKCTFTDMIRVDDYKNSAGKSVTATTYVLKSSDVVHVACTGSEKKWSSTLMGIRMDKKIWDSASWENLPDNALKMDILMFGLDSMSRNSFIRKLPKSYDYLTNVLNGDILNGYNIVGDGTPQALIPILTGKTELELPDTRKRMRNSHYVNSYPFVWNDFKDAGYVTGFFEDVPESGTFTYRLNGFEETPTDHYMRPYYLATLAERYKWPKLCSGGIPRHKVMLNAIKDFFTVYKTKPKFLFGFHGELSHDDYNLIGVADDDLLEFLKDMKESGAINNSILIIMADHGHRFAEIRNTIQGKQEERLPFFSFSFPKWFKEKHQDIYKNFQSNLNTLTTPFDIYTTLKAVLDIGNTGHADISKRSVSLFSKIPETRSCAHAYIEPHWCACLDWQKISIEDPIAERLGETLVKTVNAYTTNYRYMCEELAVSHIYWAMKMTPNQNLLNFKSNQDRDGFVPDLSDKMKIDKDLYQIKVLLRPGNSLFEASITHFIDTDKLYLNMSDISRINIYGSQARCVENDLPDLRKYCFCKNNF